MGAAFGGGGSSTVFGPRGAGSFIGKLTGIVATLFMLTSLTLAYMSSSRNTGLKDRAMEDHEAQVEDVALDDESEAANATGETKTPAAQKETVAADAGNANTAAKNDAGALVENAPAPKAALPKKVDDDLNNE